MDGAVCHFSEERERWHALAAEVVDQKVREGSWGRIEERQRDCKSHIQNAQADWVGSVHRALKRREHFHTEQVVNRLAGTRHAKEAEVEEDSRPNCLVNSRDMCKVDLARA